MSIRYGSTTFSTATLLGEQTYYPPFIKACVELMIFAQGLSWVESLQLHVVSHKLRCENWEVVSRVEVRDSRMVSYSTCMIRLIYID